MVLVSCQHCHIHQDTTVTAVNGTEIAQYIQISFETDHFCGCVSLPGEKL
jgi:hypothetical protein